MPDIDKFFGILNETKEPAYDVETNGLNWKTGYVCGYSISDGTDAEYIPVRHAGGGNIENVEQFERALARDINKHPGKIIGHNIKFDMHFSQNHGINLGDKVKCTMAREALIDENRRSYSLENVCKNYDGVIPKLGKNLYQHISNQFGCAPTRDSMGHFFRLRGDDPLAIEYGAGDTLSTSQLAMAQDKEIYAQRLDILADVEEHLTYVLQKMERRGVMIDPEERRIVLEEVNEMYHEAYSKIGGFEDEFGVITGINVRSGRDLKEYFESCEIDDWPMTAPTQRYPNGQPSFNKDFLSSTAEGLAILNVRKIAHLKSSFLDVLDDHIYKDKIHTTFNQTRGETHGTRSGRLSSSWPNMQQVPKRDKQLGRIYRRLFVPDHNFFYIEYDYSQAEPRLFTHYSQEPALIEGYRQTPFIDMYDVIASYIHQPRDTCKTIGLGIMYMMGANKLAMRLGLSYDEALDILKDLSKRFPRMLGRDYNNPGFTEKAAQVAQNRGYVKTILGRRSRFDNPRYAYRAANRIVQGGSADILKYKMIQVDNYLRENNLEEVCQMLLNIHDAIVFQIHNDYKHLVPILAGILEDVNGPPFNLSVPFVVDYKMGKNWSEATYGKAE